jgi:hypothetical protein
MYEILMCRGEKVCENKNGCDARGLTLFPAKKLKKYKK